MNTQARQKIIFSLLIFLLSITYVNGQYKETKDQISKGQKKGKAGQFSDLGGVGRCLRMVQDGFDELRIRVTIEN